MEKALDYEGVLQKYPWVLKKGLEVILSLDFDGFLSGLLGVQHLSWEVRGFYDGKRLITSTPLNHLKEVIFIDVEIYRRCVQSIGHHLLQWEGVKLTEFISTLNPNLLRGITTAEFQRKYPFGTFHFLACLLAFGGVPLNLICVRPFIYLYPNSTLFNLLNYSQNCKDWLEWLQVNRGPQSLTSLYQSLTTLHLSNIVHDFQELLEGLRSAGLGPGPRGMQRPVNSHEEADKLWSLLQKWTGWKAHPLPQWTNLVEFRPEKVNASRTKYVGMLRRNPLSFAITSLSSEGLSFTLVPQSLFHLTECPADNSKWST